MFRQQWCQAHPSWLQVALEGSARSIDVSLAEEYADEEVELPNQANHHGCIHNPPLTFRSEVGQQQSKT